MGSNPIGSTISEWYASSSAGPEVGRHRKMESGSTPMLRESTPKHYQKYNYASITQLAECRYRKPKVRSSSLLRSSKEVKREKLSHIMDFSEILERPLKSNMILIYLGRWCNGST